jgi:hypothetical protein
MATSETVGETTITTATLVDHAMRRCGKFAHEQTPETIEIAKNSLYFLLLFYANRGVNLWCIESGKIDLIASESEYELPVGTLDLLNVNFRRNPDIATYTDIPMYRMNLDEYNWLPNKSTEGTQPLQYWFDRQRTPKIHVWPVPNSGDHDIVYYRHRQIQDIGSLTQELEIPARWLEAIIWQLSLRLCFEIPGVTPERVQMVSAMADKHMIDTENEETDKSNTYISPEIGVYTS